MLHMRPRWRPRRTRRRLLIASGALAASIALLALWGCATTIVPPPPERVASDPVRVFLADYGRHASLLLPLDDDDDTRMVEYTYGEWRWYALDHAGFFHVFRAMCVRSTGALGRRYTGEPLEERELTRLLGLEAVYAITVHRDDALALRRELDRIYEAGAGEVVYNQRYALHFVKADEAYTFANNCNPVAARWLERLGCEVRGPALLSDWRVRE